MCAIEKMIVCKYFSTLLVLVLSSVIFVGHMVLSSLNYKLVPLFRNRNSHPLQNLCNTGCPRVHGS